MQHSGKVYYYMYQRGKDSKRKEIAMGSDFILVLKKYADLTVIANAGATFADIQRRYLVDAVPKLASSSARMYRSDIKHLIGSFANAPLSQISPCTSASSSTTTRTSRPPQTAASACSRSCGTRLGARGYTDLLNPCEGIQGHSLDKRTVYITDHIDKAVWKAGSAPVRDTMDLAYLTGQRPADALKMTEHDIVDGHLIVTQEKTKQPLRIQIVGELAALVARIDARKAGYKVKTVVLLVNQNGKRLTAPALRTQFYKARDAVIEKAPELEKDVKNFRFYNLRAKAADDTADGRGQEAARDLLGHDSVKTTQRHYLRRGKIVTPTK